MAKTILLENASSAIRPHNPADPFFRLGILTLGISTLSRILDRWQATAMGEGELAAFYLLAEQRAGLEMEMGEMLAQWRKDEQSL